MLDHLLNDEKKGMREEVRDSVKNVPRQLILDMDEEKVRFPKEFLREAGKRNLLGWRLPITCVTWRPMRLKHLLQTKKYLNRNSARF